MSGAAELPAWGPARTTGPDSWFLASTPDGFALTTSAGAMTFTGRDCSRLSVSRWWFGRSLIVSGPMAGRYRGVKAQDARAIRSAIAHYVTRAELAPVLDRARAFRSEFNRLLEHHCLQGRWIPYDRVAAVLRLRPSDDDVAVLREAMPGALLTPEGREALDLLVRDCTAIVRDANSRILSAELTGRRDFFDRIEKSPLTEEQARAVVTFDNRVRVVAAAGSGKTSVMVARAAYAVARGFVPPDRVLMLAFNADAAAELRARVSARLGAVGLPTDGLQASTFHSFGLALIGRATGRKASIASWVGRQGTEIDKVLAIVDELRDSSPEFRYKWDTFRLLYGRMSDTPEAGDHDSYDRSTRQNGFRTYRGETVRSEGAPHRGLAVPQRRRLPLRAAVRPRRRRPRLLAVPAHT